jgi:hypothetical protein
MEDSMPAIRLKRMWWVPGSALLLAAAACGRADRSRVDDALKNDLALASQAQAYQPQQFMSPTEQAYANPYANPYGYQYPNAQYGYPRQIQTVARAPYPSSPARTTRSTSASRSSSGTYSTRPAEPIRNTKRDAVIGAAAGAVLGATTSRDKVKGAIIGAAAGGILGGIIGHTVDVKQP